MQTYLYTFDYVGEFHYRDEIPVFYGAQHSDDLIYLFPYPPHAIVLNEKDKEIAKRMVNLWTSFATNGVPIAKGTPIWPPLMSTYSFQQTLYYCKLYVLVLVFY